MTRYINKLQSNCSYNKASVIGKLIKNGIQVPRGIVVNSHFFKKLVANFESTTNTSIFNKKMEMKKVISNIKFPDEFIEDLRNEIQSFNEVIIRSNFFDEDGKISSNAGSYETVGPIDSQVEKVIDSIKQVWISGAMINSRNFFNASVIVQEYLNFDVNGVAFYSTSEEVENINIEVSTIGGAIEAGKEPMFTINSSYSEISRNNGGKNLLSKKHYDKLVSIFRDMDHLLRYDNGIDVEWGIINDCVYIVQVRPITVINKTPRNLVCDGPTYIDMDSSEVTQLLLPKFYDILVQKHWDKRHWMKESVKGKDVNVYSLGFLFFKRCFLVSSPMVLSNLLKRNIHTSLVYAIGEFNGIKYEGVFDVDSLFENVLIFLNENNITNIHSDIVDILWVSEFYIPDVSGLVTSSNGYTVVEFILGDLAGLKKSDMTFSKYLLNTNGEIDSEEIVSSKEYYSFIFEGQWKLKKCQNLGREIPKLSSTEINTISKLPKIISSNVTSVEWIKKAGKIILYDISVDKSGSDITELNIISPGNARGYAYKISDSDILDIEKSSQFHLSVDDSLYEREAIENSKKVKVFIEKLKKKAINKPIIVFAPYPATILSIVSPYVEGFVFAKGASLSHLGIKLREAGIPAVVSKKDIDIDDNDSIYTITGGILRKEQ